MKDTVIQETTIMVKGFHCASCGVLIKDVATDFAEIVGCDVDVKTGKVVIKHKKSFNINKFKEEIRSLGDYTVA